jgi:hypothetical protein
MAKKATATATQDVVASATLCINDAGRITGVTLSSEVEDQLWTIKGNQITFTGFDSLQVQFDSVERNGKFAFVRAKSKDFTLLVDKLIELGLLTNPEDWE